jgi:pimeloyl-ACP methyl ester carboxylesterase
LKRLLQLAAVVIALACAGAAYEVIGGWRDAHRFGQHGKSVHAGPVTLNLDCEGRGRPTVILESGARPSARSWLLVQPEVARFTRVCSYDRAGYGWSEPGPEPRTSLQIARELKGVLDAAGEKGPFVLVGHSMGGFHVRVFAGQYASDVAGMVLVDGTPEDVDERLDSKRPAAVKERDERRARNDRLLAPVIIHLGIERVGVALGWIDIRKTLEPTWNVNAFRLSNDALLELLYLDRQSKHRRAMASENADEHFFASVDQVRRAGKLGDKPLIVLTAGRFPDDPLVTPKQHAEGLRIWTEMLAEEARLSTRGKQVIVSDSDHMIPFERPDAIVSGIHEVWTTVRADQR